MTPHRTVAWPCPTLRLQDAADIRGVLQAKELLDGSWRGSDASKMVALWDAHQLWLPCRMQLFAKVAYYDTLNEHVNFRTFDRAFITLLRFTKEVLYFLANLLAKLSARDQD